MNPDAKAKDQNTSVWLFYGLLLIFIFEYMRPGSLEFRQALKLNTAIPISVFILSFLSKRGPRNLEVINATNTRWLLLFLFLLILSFITADVKLYVYETFKTVIGYVIFYYAIVKNVTNEKRVSILFLLLIMIHIALILLNPDVILESRVSIRGVTFLGDGNDFALSVCIIIPFAIYLIQTSERYYKKIIVISFIAILIYAVIGTQSRGGFIALVSICLYICMYSKNKIKISITAIIIAVIIGIAAPQAFYDRIISIKDYETEGSAQGRIMAWKSAISMGMNNPIVGVGAGHFPVKYGTEYRPPGVGRTDIPWSTAHSIYFLAFGEFGFPGLIFLVGLVTHNIMRCNKYIKILENIGSDSAVRYMMLAITVNSSMIAFAVGGLFLSALYYPHLFVLVGINESVISTIAKQENINLRSNIHAEVGLRTINDNMMKSRSPGTVNILQV